MATAPAPARRRTGPARADRAARAVTRRVFTTARGQPDPPAGDTDVAAAPLPPDVVAAARRLAWRAPRLIPHVEAGLPLQAAAKAAGWPGDGRRIAVRHQKNTQQIEGD